MRSTNPTHSTLVPLIALEQTIRSLKRRLFAVFAAVVLLAAYVLSNSQSIATAGPPPGDDPSGDKRIRAKTIEIIGNQGQVLMRLGSDHDVPKIVISDAEGNPRLHMGLVRFSSIDFGPFIAFSDTRGNTPIFLGSNNECEPYLAFKDKNDNSRIVIQLAHMKQSRIDIYDKDKNNVWGIAK